jgi:nitroimidazol reductase NimA-like FMN-containing flavoprotein (pyridoxamine 5'-phosphate oxidase superfamily)
LTNKITDRKDLINLKVPLRLACLTSSGWPMIVPLWFTFLNNRLYCATQENAKIISYLKKDPRCAFDISTENPPYKGMRGQGKIKINKDCSTEVLEIVIQKYLRNKYKNLTEYLLKKKRK